MRYLIILLAVGMLVGCATRQTITPEQIRANALYVCNSAGFQPETDAHANCMMVEFQRQADSINAYNAQRRAIWAGAVYKSGQDLSNSYYHRANQYQYHAPAPIYKYQGPTTTRCQPSGGGIMCSHTKY